MTEGRSGKYLRWERRLSPFVRAALLLSGASLIAASAATYWYLIWPLGSEGWLYAIFAIIAARLGVSTIHAALTSEGATTSIYRGRVDMETHGLFEQHQLSFSIGDMKQFVVVEEKLLGLRSYWSVNLIPRQGKAKRICILRNRDQAMHFRDETETLFYSGVDQHYIDQNRYLN